MGCSKDCNGGSKLCPVSFGLAVGVVCFFGMLIWSIWVMTYGMPSMMNDIPMPEMHMAVPTLSVAFVHSLLCLFKGFIFGFFVALFYDVFSCCFKKHKSSCQSGCQCGNANCKCGSSANCRCGSSPDKL